MSAEGFDGDLAVAAAADAAADREPNLERKVAAALPVRKSPVRIRPTTEEHEAVVAGLLSDRTAAYIARDKAKRALMLGLPTAVAVGVVIGWAL